MAKKENYVILRSIFGDYWVGKTLMKVNNRSVFSTFDETIAEAIEITDSVENTEELQNCLKKECEIVIKEMEKWIIK